MKRFKEYVSVGPSAGHIHPVADLLNAEMDWLVDVWQLLITLVDVRLMQPGRPDAEDDEEDDMKKDKEEYSTETMLAEVGTVVKELLEEVRNDISRLNSELDELRNENLAKDENIAELQDENTELSKQVKTLGGEAGDKPVTMKKFNKNNNTVSLSKSEYNRLSRKEKYWYNLNN